MQSSKGKHIVATLSDPPSVRLNFVSMLLVESSLQLLAGIQGSFMETINIK
jgi:hypothetical protein